MNRARILLLSAAVAASSAISAAYQSSQSVDPDQAVIADEALAGLGFRRYDDGARSARLLTAEFARQFMSSDHASLGLRLPAHWVDASMESPASGLGDLEMTYRQQILRREGGMNASFGLEATAPIGSASRGLGRGRWGVAPFAALKTSLGQAWLHGSFAALYGIGTDPADAPSPRVNYASPREQREFRGHAGLYFGVPRGGGVNFAVAGWFPRSGGRGGQTILEARPELVSRMTKNNEVVLQGLIPLTGDHLYDYGFSVLVRRTLPY